MKPRTRLQLEVINNSRQLYKIDDEMLSWAKRDILEHKGFATKTRVICMDCGESFSPDLVSRKRAVCPHCNTKLKIGQTRKIKFSQEEYVAFAQIVGEFQVIRNFRIMSNHRAGRHGRYYSREVLQHWILPDGKREVVALSMNQNHTGWVGELEIRDKKQGNVYNGNYGDRDVYPSAYHPESDFKPMYRKYGIDRDLKGLTFLEAIKLLPESPMAETLCKAKRYDLLSHANNRYSNTYRHWPSIKICLRNKYKITDVKMWFDYLDLLQYSGKDLRNAHYVCPKNLNKEHDYWMKKKRKRQDEEEAERKRLRALKNEKKFNELKSIFFGIAFSEGGISVHVIDSVKEVMREGDELHHCVFTNEYYIKEDSLILSAQIRGKRIETVEVSLKQLKVVQCRGLQNKNTEYHDRIISLVNKNMHLIKERLKSKKDETKRNDRRTIAPRAVAV